MKLRARLSLRFLLLIFIAIGLFLATWGGAAVRQQRAVRLLQSSEPYVSHSMELTYKWFRYLPKSVLDLQQRHWFHSVHEVKLEWSRLQNGLLDRATFEALVSLPSLRSIELKRLEISPEIALEFHRLNASEIKLSECSCYAAQGVVFSTHLKSLELSYSPTVVSFLRNLSHHAGIESIDVSNTQIYDEDLVYLRNMPSLKKLSVWCVNRNGPSEVLDSLGAFPKLEELRIANALTQIPSSVVGKFSRFGQLKSIAIPRTEQLNDAVRQLAPLQGLESIDFSQLPDPESVRELVCFPKLKSILVASSVGPVTKELLIELGKLPALQSVRIGTTKYSLAGLAELAESERLGEFEDRNPYNFGWYRNSLDALIGNASNDSERRIDLSNLIDVSDHLGFLSRYPKLEQLSLRNTDVTADGLKHVAELRQLLSLDLDSTSIEDNDLSLLGPLTNLEKLYVVGCHITEAPIPNLPNLKELWIGSPRVSEKAFANIAKLTTLESLHLTGCQLTEESCRSLQQLRSLKSLTLEACKADDRAIASLTQIPALTDIVLDDLRIGPESIQAIQQSKLEYLGIRESSLSKEDWESLIAKCPSMRTDLENAFASSLNQDEEEWDGDPFGLTPTEQRDGQITTEMAARIGSKEESQLSLINCTFPPEALRLMTDHSQLKRLQLRRCDVTNEHIAAIGEKATQSLTEIQIEGTRVDAAVLQALNRFHNPVIVKLSGTSVTMKDAVSGLKLERLAWLECEGQWIDASQLRYFRTRNAAYFIDEAKWTNRIWTPELLEPFRGHSRINSLLIQDVSDPVVAIQIACSMKRLHDLQLSGISLTPTDFATLGTCQSLKRLSIENCKISQKDLDAMNSGLGKLEGLGFENIDLRELDVASLVNHCQVDDLSFENCQFGDTDFARFTATLQQETKRKIVDLNMTGTQLTTKSIDRLLEFENLSLLRVSETNFSNFDCHFLRSRIPTMDVWR
jgi:internalin A